MKRQFIRLMTVAALVCCLTLPVWAQPKALIPGGCTIGVKLQSPGPVVTGFEEKSAAADAGMRKGDVILRIDGKSVCTAAELREMLAADSVILTVLRNGREAAFCVTPQNGQIGAYVQDSVAGIGTVTYYDPNTGMFGALGHGVSQGDTGHLMPMEAGVAVCASVVDVIKGKNGTPGELKGKFDTQRILGRVEQNHMNGIFGVMHVPVTGTPVPLATYSQVETGPAEIMANVSGEKIGRYAVEILKVYPNADESGRNMLLRVTDPELLNTTGGIIRGMSGSPIVQNGKLVGAVTHVLVNDPTRGYGIFIENMLDAAG